MNAKEITAYLTTPAIEVLTFDTIDSTNTAAKRLIANGEITGTNALIANEQSAGYGRHGRSFYSPDATGLYLTVIQPLKQIKASPGLITTGIATVAAETLSNQLAVEVGIKWVNDLYYQERKVAGILVEQVEDATTSYLVIGFGLNLLTNTFPKGLANKAGALLTNVEVNRASLTAALIEAFIGYFESDSSAILARYRARSLVIGEYVELLLGQEKLKGRVKAINDQAGLVIETSTGQEKTLYAGEITKLYMTDWTVS
ncbi:biotin--[acetyl-CoA carboxylase] ligase [Weissella oryzae SG25]|uniref:biotin--[biotin carboxyl-carrier protein] ligase n=1 Tax=Weissella oryzae (strain DSM 25784 / JCM 18191 / LMG 30913 / SG25) TaxID=1329250 RepID=A0A069CTT4_WEIOS|nr:biotin--[acetyl-CoA-carboxylase] ligase [Weissella oryzae]GAK30899.1 biotin--[acetyl-CoA carboxylase] ligase [Weissella oryzae SG25]